MMFIPEIVDWAFSKKQSNLLHITEHFGENQRNLFKFLEVFQLVEQLKSNNCLNIQDKFANTTDWEKFNSLSSELCFANELIKLGFSVSLIPDNTPEWTIEEGKKKRDNTSPDISAVKNGQEFLIEVARISDDETTSEISDFIDILARVNSVCVEINKYSKKFSLPVLSRNERTERHELIAKFLDEFEKIIKTVDPSSLPQKRDIYDCNVIFSKPPDGMPGYCGGYVTDCVRIPEEKFKLQIAKTVEAKAKKRDSWKDCQKQKPYLIALDIKQNWIRPEILVSLLFGDQSYFPPPAEPRYSELPIVSEAKARGWQKLLEEVGFSNQTHSPVIWRSPFWQIYFLTLTPESESYSLKKYKYADSKLRYFPVINHGLFITNACVSRNITGVIARIGRELYCLPNPFAEESINLLDLHKEIPWLLQRFRGT